MPSCIHGGPGLADAESRGSSARLVLLSIPRELDRSTWQKIKHVGPASADCRFMGASGTVHQPTCGMIVESSIAFQRHNQVDLAVGMHMMRSDDVLHLHYVNAEVMRSGTRLNHPAVSNAASFPLADPAFLGSLFTSA